MIGSDLAQEISHLVSLQHEGNYWDFKQEWHHNKAELLHDILCLANSPANRDKYLIIGIKESSKTKHFSVAGVKSKDTNQKGTKEVNDFLSTKKFVGNIRPMVHVKRVKINGKRVDVIIIESSNNTPFILAEDYYDQPENAARVTVMCGHLYSRVMDMNTPINKTADNDITELLWRRRFRIDATPIDKLTYYLSSPENWTPLDEVSGNEFAYYYKYAPEYKLYFSLDEDGKEDFLGKNWIVGTAKYSRISFKVSDSTIATYWYNASDKLEYSFVRPSYRTLGETCVDSLMMAYYIQGSPEHCLSFFIKKKLRGESGGFREDDPLREQNIIVFQSEEERTKFEEYISGIAYSIVLPQIWSFVDENKSKKWSRENYTDWVSTIVLKKMYVGWKSSHMS